MKHSLGTRVERGRGQNRKCRTDSRDISRTQRLRQKIPSHCEPIRARFACQPDGGVEWYPITREDICADIDANVLVRVVALSYVD